MGYLFFDTSALVKRYYEKRETAVVDSLIERNDETVVITSLAVVETTSAMRRKYNADTLSEEELPLLVANFYHEALGNFLVVPLDDVTLEHTLDLVLEGDLRTLDSLQLSAALSFAGAVDELQFVCSDRELATTASALDSEAVHKSAATDNTKSMKKV